MLMMADAELPILPMIAADYFQPAASSLLPLSEPPPARIRHY
jgi:hypothetical protein